MKVKLLATVTVLLLAVAVGNSGPVDGPKRFSTILHPGQTTLFKKAFKAGERACVILEGDHNPVMNLNVVVFDEKNQVVARDQGGDFLAAIWYPMREGTYTIQVKMMDQEKIENKLTIVVK